MNVSALITGHESVGDHTEFIIQISCSGVVWLISRRFSDFDHLHSCISQQLSSKNPAVLPEKQWFGRFDPGFLSKRQARLQLYLDSVFQEPGILESHVFQRFLEIDKNVDLSGGIALYSSLCGGENGFVGSNNSMSYSGSGNFGGGINGSGMCNKKSIISEADRLRGIVEKSAHVFIDVSQLPEPLENDQALQKRSEVLSAYQEQFNNYSNRNSNDERLANSLQGCTSMDPSAIKELMCEQMDMDQIQNNLDLIYIEIVKELEQETSISSLVAEKRGNSKDGLLAILSSTVNGDQNNEEKSVQANDSLPLVNGNSVINE